MGGTGSGGHSNSGRKSNASKERTAAEKQGRTLEQLWSNQQRYASQSGLQEHLNHIPVDHTTDEVTERKADEGNNSSLPAVILVCGSTENSRTGECDEEEVEDDIQGENENNCESKSPNDDYDLDNAFDHAVPD